MSTLRDRPRGDVSTGAFATGLGLWVLIAVSGSGCSGSGALIADQAVEIDSLRSLNSALAHELDTYRDSIAFYDFIESGEFDREIRFKNTQVNRLTYELAVCLDGGETIATELVDDLFAAASADLTDRGRERLALLAEALAEKSTTGQIHVEGYSDSTRPAGELKKRYPTNWELSAARAAAVVQYYIDVHGIDEERLVVISLGANHPISTNASQRGRRLNRRIRFSHIPLR
ncbi:MAG: OmpA family protein [Rhodothermales bacterium]|nr:OmpA family protein [Rhodothermales bacterium]